MRRYVVLVALALAVLLSGLAGAGVTAKPTLRVFDRSPLVLQGTGFRQSERVTVTLITGLGPRRARATATSGRFKVSFAVAGPGCGAVWAARAVGDRGSIASVVLGPGVCVPPPRE